MQPRLWHLDLWFRPLRQGGSSLHHILLWIFCRFPRSMVSEGRVVDSLDGTSPHPSIFWIPLENKWGHMGRERYSHALDKNVRKNSTHAELSSFEQLQSPKVRLCLREGTRITSDCMPLTVHVLWHPFSDRLKISFTVFDSFKE